MRNLNLIFKIISALLIINTNTFAWESNQGGFIELDINKDFTLIYGGSGNAVKGDFTATGNTIMDGNTNTTYFAGSTPVMLSQDSNLSAYGTSSKNQNSSSAPLSLPSFVKAEHIVWAGLFWQGQIHDTASTTNEVNTDVSGWNTVRLKTPDGVIHTITATIGSNTASNSTYHYAHVRNRQYRFFHSSYVDVTNIVQNGGYTSDNNTFTVGNLMATAGKDTDSQIYYNHINEPDGAWYNLHMGHFGGWSLVVVYDVDAQTAQDNPNDVKVRNISLYNGFDLFSFWTGNAGDKFETTLSLTGFLTPQAGSISSKMLFFGGGGDYGMAFDTLQIEDGNNPGTFMNLTNSKNTGTQLFNGTYTNLNNDIISSKTYFQGMDLDIYDTSAAMTHDQTSTNIKFGVVQQSGYIDQVFPQIIAFSTELFQPDLCYDYTYGQNGFYTIAPDTDRPYINDDFDSTKPLDIKLYIRNREASDVILTNTYMHIKDINTAQAIYSRDSTQIVPAGGTLQDAPDAGRDVNDANDLNISIGTVNGLEHFYTYYSLDFAQTNTNGAIDMPINAFIQYDLSVNGITLGSQELPLNSLEICQGSGSYLPVVGQFNVVHASQNKSADPHYYYNLPTQVVKRSGHFLLESMKDAPNYNAADTATATTVKMAAVEMIDVDGFHYSNATCTDPTVTAVSNNRVWTLIDEGSYASSIDQTNLFDEGFFDTAISNAAFRITYNKSADDSLVLFEKLGNDSYKLINFPGYGGGRCHESFNPPTGNSMQISSWCGSNTGGNGNGNGGGGQSGMGVANGELQTCMECLYGYNIGTLCSRDNFAIRPEAYNIRLIDQNQSDTTQTQTITNNTPAPNPINLAAGYTYQVEVNATDHLNGMPTPRYHASDVNATLVWVPTSDDSKCNDTENNESSISFSDGYSRTSRLLNQVGRYTLQHIDSLWTKVDHGSAFMTQHQTPYFTSSPDCIINDNSVQPSSSFEQNGCDISSNHTNSEFSKTFTDMNITFYPYTFDQGALSNIIGPASRLSGQTFIYMDTPSTLDADNTDMSYNLNGTFYASGYNGAKLSNFVAGCYADDLNMDLNYTYNSPPPTQAPYLSYSLKNTNTISNIITRPSSGSGLEVPTTEPVNSNTPLRIVQAELEFAKDMNGSITMDLGYNFKRDYNKVVNPRYIEFKDFNITYVTPPSAVYADMKTDYEIFGNKTLDRNVTFVYGRAKPSQDLYDDVTAASINTPTSIVVYCDQDPITCSAVYNINTTLGKTDEYNWYLSLGHIRSQNDGNITLRTDGLATTGNGSVTPTDPTVVNIENSGGVDTTVFVSATDATRPQDVNIDFGTNANRWLIYNKSLNAIPSPFYRVRFIGQSDWAGHGDTGHVVGGKSNVKKNNRSGW